MQNYLNKQNLVLRNRYLDLLNDPRIHGVNGLFALSFKGKDDRESYNTTAC